MRKYHVVGLHDICDIEMVQRRMDKLHLSLMYPRSCRLLLRDGVGEEPIHNTRSTQKVVFLLCRKITRFYKRSPYYRGVVFKDKVYDSTVL